MIKTIKNYMFAVCLILFCSSMVATLTLAEHGSLKQHKEILLTEEEKAFLKAHPTIRFGANETWAPAVIKKADGTLEGFDVDLIHYINERTRANIQLVTGRWAEIVEQAKDLKIDGLTVSAASAERKPFFNFSNKYLEVFPVFVVAKNSTLKIEGMTDLEGKSVAILEGNQFNLELLGKYPSINIIEAPTEADAIRLVIEGKADAAIVPSTSYGKHNKPFLNLIRIGHISTDNPIKIVYSIRKDWPELVSIINKALDSLPPETKNNIYSRWFGETVEEEESLPKTPLVWIFGVSILMLFVLLILNKLKIVKLEKNAVMLLLAAALLLIIGLFVTNAFNITRNLKETAVENYYDTLRATASSLHVNVEQHITHIKNAFHVLSSRKTISNEDLMKIVEFGKDFSEVFILDSSGKITHSSEISHVGLSRAADPYFLNIKKGIYIKPIYFSETIGKVSFTISTPYNGGVLVARLRFDHVHEIISKNRGLGESGESLLAYRNKNGDAVFFTKRRFTTEAQARDVIPKEDVNTPITQALLGNEREFSGNMDYRGVVVLAVTKYIEMVDVGLVVKIDKEEALKSVSENINQIWYSTTGSILAIIIIGIIFYFLLTNSLRREVKRKTSDLEKASDELKDNLAATEAFLGAQFDTFFVFDPANGDAIRWNNKFTEVSGYSNDEIKSMKAPQSYYSEEDLKKAVEAIEKLQKEGKALIEMSLITKSGKKISFEYSASTVSVDNRNLIIAVGRDITDRKKAEETLKNEKAFIESVMNAAPDTIYIFDPETGEPVYWNQANMNLLGYSNDEMKTQLAASESFYKKEDLNRLAGAVQECIKNGHASIEAEVRAKNGTYIPFEYKLSLLNKEMKNGNICVIGRDITERKKAEEELLGYKNIVSCSNEMMALLDRNYVYLAANDAYLEAFGFSSTDIIGKPVTTVFGEVFFKEVIKPNADKCLKGEEIHFQDWFDFPKTGRKYMDISYFPHFGQKDEIEGFVVNARNITDRKEAEVVLKESKETAEMYLNIAAEIIVSIDTKGDIILLNDSGHKMLGYKNGDIVGKNWFDTCLPERLRKDVKNAFNKIMKGEISSTKTYENPVIMKNGQEKLLFWHNEVVKDNEGKIIGVLSSGEDITQRKQAEEEILNIAKFPSENPNPIARISQDGILMYANDSFMKEIVRTETKVGDKIPEQWLKMIEEVYNSGKKNEIEYELDNKVYSFELIPVTEAGYINVYGKDITESKKAEEELKERAKELACLYNISKVIEKEGIKLDEILQEIVDAMPPGWQYPDLTCARLVFEGKEYVSAKFKETNWKLAQEIQKGTKKAGVLEVYYLEKMPNFDKGPFFKEERDLINAIVETIVGISERKGVEEALALQRYYMAKAQEIGRIGSWKLDLKKNELIWTDENYRVFGVPIGTPLSYETFLGCVHPDDREYVNKEFKEALTGKPYDIEHRLIVDGSVKWVREKAEFDFDETGACISAVGFTQDITDNKMLLEKEKELVKAITKAETQKERADELQLAYDKLKEADNQVIQAEKLSAIGAITASIMHELKQPLNNIQLISRVLLRRGSGDDVTGDAKDIEGQIKRMVTIINHMGVYSRISSSKPGKVSVNATLDEVLKFTAPRLKENTIEIKKDFVSDLPDVTGDPVRLEQLFVNLINNAISALEDTDLHGNKARIHTDTDKTITIKTAAAESAEDETVIVEIKDNGSGIPEDIRKKMFKPFFTTKAPGKGTGLGLSVVNKILKEHNGKIEVESNPGEGSMFRVILKA